MSDGPKLDACQLRRGIKTGTWITVKMSTVNGTEMGDQEWRYVLLICYGIELRDLPYHCDGWNSAFSICHVLDWKKRGLITTRHNDIRDKVTNLAGKAFTPSNVRKDTLIHPGCAVQEGNDKPVGKLISNPPVAVENPEHMGDLLIRDLYRERRTVFTACMSWTLRPSPTGTSLRRNVFIWKRKRRRRSTWSLVSSNTDTYPPSSSRWTAYLVWRWKPCLNK